LPTKEAARTTALERTELLEAALEVTSDLEMREPKPFFKPSNRTEEGDAVLCEASDRAQTGALASEVAAILAELRFRH
jgi:hypothetical protein